jgi:predicted methyltransferase
VKHTTILVMLFCINGCGGLDPLASEDLATSAGATGAVTPNVAAPPSAARRIEDVMRDPRRRADDRARDDQRRADAVLAFFGIQPGMTVLDLYSGGGYYTELLSLLVGKDGRVIAHNNQPYEQFARDELADRYRPGRLENVTRLTAENNALELPAEKFDAVLMILSYHDVYFVDADGGWPAIDRPALLAEIYGALKPGGIVGIVDHAAASGAPAETGGTLHRLDPAIIKRDLQRAGFVLEAESSILRNPADDYGKSVFDPAVRGRTDRAVLRFRKPAADGSR